MVDVVCEVEFQESHERKCHVLFMRLICSESAEKIASYVMWV